MKKLTLLFALAFFCFTNPAYAQNEEAIRLSEPVETTDTYEVFGAGVEKWDEVLSLSEAIQALESVSHMVSASELTIEPITIESEVTEVCAKKGCFFVATDGEYTARITFEDYSFFIPTDSQGKKVKLVGALSVKELSEEKAKHYAEDAGINPDTISGPQEEYSIVATSVLIYKN